MRGELQARRDLARILDDSFALYREHWRTLVAVAAIVVVPVQLGVLGVGLGWLWQPYDSSRPIGEAAVGGVAQLLIVTPLVTAMVVRVLTTAGEGGRPAVAPTLRFGFEVFAAVFWAVLIMWLGIVAGLLLIVPGIVFAVRWAVVPQAVVAEGQRGVAALRRSSELTRGHWWWTLAVLVVVNLVASVLAGIVTIPAPYLADSVNAQAIVLVAAVVGQTFTVPLVALGTTLLFFSLRAGRDTPVAMRRSEPPADPITGERIAPSPAIGDEAWERRRREGWLPPGS